MNSNKIVSLSLRASQYLNVGRGRPENSQPGSAALRNAGVPAYELRHRLGAFLKNVVLPLFLVVLFASASCFGSDESASRDKEKKHPEHHRGWIGGEYRLARRNWKWFDKTDAVIAFPTALTNTQQGVLITALATNTPAYLAGLRETDLILELDHDKIASLADFRKKIDRAKPGSTLALRAYRDGETHDYNVTVGRETFRDGGALAIGLFYDLPSLKFNPSFSLIALGLYRETDKRTELGSAEEIFRRENVKEHHPADTCWRAWAGPFFVTRTREIRSQESVAR